MATAIVRPRPAQRGYRLSANQPQGQGQGQGQDQWQGQELEGPGTAGGNGGDPNPYAVPGGAPDTSWFNPYGTSVTSQPPASLPASSVPYYSGSDLAQQYQNNRNVQMNQGDMFNQYFNNQASQRAGAEQAATAKANQLYGQLEQTPGYTQEQQDAILGNRPGGGNNYQDLLNTDYASNYLSPEEQAQMRGDPYAPGRQLDPNILDNVNQTASNMRTGAISGAEDRLNQNYGSTEGNLRAAVDPNQLNLSKAYQDTTSNILQTTGNKVNEAAYNPELAMSGEYGRQAGMTDQEVADTAAMGGQAVGARSRSAIQDLERQAAASGNASPLAVAAARREFEDQNAVQGADATVNAQLAARQVQRGAATGVESTRLGANQYRTGAQISGAEAMGNLAQNATTTEEQMRMAGAQDISNRNMGIANQMGQIGQENAGTLLNAQTANANAYGQAGMQAGQFNQAMGYNAAATAEQNQANRAAAIGTNRQNTSQTNQGNQFNRGYTVNAQNSNLQQGIANTGLAGQRETRGYYTGQQQYQGGQGNQAQANMLQNRQQTQTGVNQATQGAAGWELGNKNAPNWFTKNVIPAVNASANAYKAYKP